MKTIRTLTALIFSIAILFSPQAYAEDEKIILAMGDSLMAGYNLPPNTGFPHQLEAWLQERGNNVRVINAGVSGDTSSAALARLEWTLSGAPGGKPDLFIVEFGGNDMLRGIEPSVTRSNMDAILKIATERDIKVLLAGMLAAPNLGSNYRTDFDAIFPEMADKYDVAFYPFFLNGVAGDQSLNLDDGIHPNVEGVAIMVDNMGPMIEDLIDE